MPNCPVLNCPVPKCPLITQLQKNQKNRTSDSLFFSAANWTLTYSFISLKRGWHQIFSGGHYNAYESTGIILKYYLSYIWPWQDFFDSQYESGHHLISSQKAILGEDLGLWAQFISSSSSFSSYFPSYSSSSSSSEEEGGPVARYSTRLVEYLTTSCPIMGVRTLAMEWITMGEIPVFCPSSSSLRGSCT